jgi:Tfp pilus assembly protein PilX
VARLNSSRLRQEAVTAVKLKLAESMLGDCERQLMETQAALQVRACGDVQQHCAQGARRLPSRTARLRLWLRE